MNKLKTFLKNFKVFRKIYINNLIIGGRVSRDYLMYVIKNEKVVDYALQSIYIECPSKFPGESKFTKHYLLKNFWRALHVFYCSYANIKKDPKYTFRYIKYFISEIKSINKDFKFYMDPNKLIRP